MFLLEKGLGIDSADSATTDDLHGPQAACTELPGRTVRYEGAGVPQVDSTFMTQQRRQCMNKDIAQGNFTQLKGKIKQKWGKLTDDEIDQMEGHADVLAGKLQERYGWERDEAERQAKEFRTQHNWQ